MCTGERRRDLREWQEREHPNIGIRTHEQVHRDSFVFPELNDTMRKLIGPLLEMQDLNLKPF